MPVIAQSDITLGHYWGALSLDDRTFLLRHTHVRHMGLLPFYSADEAYAVAYKAIPYSVKDAMCKQHIMQVLKPHGAFTPTAATRYRWLK